MIAPILIGVLAAVVATVPRLAREAFPSLPWSSPFFLLLFAACAAVVWRSSRRWSYTGLADLFLHIHTPAGPDTPARWLLRGVSSFLLNAFGGVVGPEGAAIEVSQAAQTRTRSRATRWFEQQRRTDASTAISAGIAATFSAPFAAILLPLELGIGGRTLSSAFSALAATLTLVFLSGLRPATRFDVGGALYGFQFPGIKGWLAILALGLLCGLFGTLLVRLVRYGQDSFRFSVGRNTGWMMLVGGLLLFAIAIAYPPAHDLNGDLLESVLWSRKTGVEVALILFAKTLVFVLVLSALGTLGVFLPLAALGGFLGFVLNGAILQGAVGYPALAGLIGGAALWAVVFGTPLAGAVLAFEITQNGYVLVPCFVAGLLAQEVRKRLKTRTLAQEELSARGMGLIGGRSAKILKAIQIRDAMVKEFETVQEHEPVSELYKRLRRAQNPFLPVVNSQGKYVGLLTVDMVEEGWEQDTSSESSLGRLLEAKDILYRSGFKPPTVPLEADLSVTTRVFEEVPCVPVLDAGGHVQGLLFVYNVRLAYDQEVARRMLDTGTPLDSTAPGMR